MLDTRDHIMNKIDNMVDLPHIGLINIKLFCEYNIQIIY